MKLFKIIPTWIFWEMFWIFVVLQIGFLLFFIIIGICLQEGLGHLSPSQILTLIPYIYPFAQTFCGQFVMVFTCARIYSRLKYSNEIIALQSSGISAWRVMAPAFTLSLFMSFLSFWMADVKCSWGKQGLQKTILASLESVVCGTLESQKCIPLGKEYILGVSAVEDKKILYDMYVTSVNTEKSRVIYSEKAEFEMGPAAEIISPDEKCYTQSLEYYPYSPTDRAHVVKLKVVKPECKLENEQFSIGDETIIVISLDEILSMTTAPSSRPSDMSLKELDEYVGEQNAEIQNQKLLMAFQSVRNMESGFWWDYASPNWDLFYGQNIRECEKRIRRAKIEPTRRLAFALNCFCLTWICAPFSLKRGGSGTLMLICTTIMPILLTYYPITMLCLQLVKENSCSPLILLFPNVLAFIIGIFVIRKAL